MTRLQIIILLIVIAIFTYFAWQDEAEHNDYALIVSEINYE